MMSLSPGRVLSTNIPVSGSNTASVFMFGGSERSVRIHARYNPHTPSGAWPAREKGAECCRELLCRQGIPAPEEAEEGLAFLILTYAHKSGRQRHYRAGSSFIIFRKAVFRKIISEHLQSKLYRFLCAQGRVGCKYLLQHLLALLRCESKHNKSGHRIVISLTRRGHTIN